MYAHTYMLCLHTYKSMPVYVYACKSIEISNRKVVHGHDSTFMTMERRLAGISIQVSTLDGQLINVV